MSPGIPNNPRALDFVREVFSSCRGRFSTKCTVAPPSSYIISARKRELKKYENLRYCRVHNTVARPSHRTHDQFPLLVVAVFRFDNTRNLPLHDAHIIRVNVLTIDAHVVRHMLPLPRCHTEQREQTAGNPPPIPKTSAGAYYEKVSHLPSRDWVPLVSVGQM